MAILDFNNANDFDSQLAEHSTIEYRDDSINILSATRVLKKDAYETNWKVFYRIEYTPNGGTTTTFRTSRLLEAFQVFDIFLETSETFERMEESIDEDYHYMNSLD